MTITNMRLNLLATVEEICGESGGGFASPAEICRKLKRDPRRVSKMILKLRDIGWLERPYHACYRLTDEGTKILREAKGEAQEPV